MESFHKRLGRLREASQLTMEGIAQQLGVPVTTYREWEYGRQPRGTHVYGKLAKIFGVSLHELLTGEKVKSERVLERFDLAVRALEEIRSELISLL